MTIDRTWAMPNKNTFTISPVRALICRYWQEGLSIDPFANSSKLATYTNDLDPVFDTDYHMDALDFLKMFPAESVDTLLFDPPFSARQVSESYHKMGMTVNFETTQSSYWRNLKEEVARIVKPGGVVFSCAWNSGGIGKKYGFEIEHIRLVAHGGSHNDTIVVVEKKLKGTALPQQLKF